MADARLVAHRRVDGRDVVAGRALVDAEPNLPSHRAQGVRRRSSLSRAEAFLVFDEQRKVTRSPPRELSPASRRHVAQLLSKVLSLAVYPLRLRASSPLPRGFLPKLGARPALSWLYPEEDAALLATKHVPLVWRLLEGFLAREGMRLSEAVALAWSDLDLARGTIRLDVNKTDEPRTWALGADVVRALSWWRRQRPTAELVFAADDGSPLYSEHAADALRDHLAAAKVTRAELFARSTNRRPIRMHDLRATFVTLALATGRSETWVKDRTGHTTSTMLERYRRQARHASELRMGWLSPLDCAIPEASEGLGSAPGGALNNGHEGGHDVVRVVRRGRPKVRKDNEKPKWRNGRRGGFKIRCPNGLVGSTPTFGTR